MINNAKQWIIIALMLVTIFFTFVSPAQKYKSEDILSTLNIPLNLTSWHGNDISDGFINLEDKTYNFISNVFAADYSNESDKNLIFSIIQAAHFHHPKVCFTGAGYNTRELKDEEITVNNHKLKIYSHYFWKTGDGLLITYWMCIDKKNPGWTEQLWKLLLASLFNKKTISLMVRIDIPAKEKEIGTSAKLVKEFIKDLNNNIHQEARDYIFGI